MLFSSVSCLNQSFGAYDWLNWIDCWLNWTDAEANWDADENEDDWDDCDDWNADDWDDWIDWDKFDWDACKINRIWLITYDDRYNSKNAYWFIDA